MNTTPTAADPDALSWELGGTSRIPFAVYTDEQRHQRELERFFYQGHWCYVGLEAEIPKPGDFKRIVEQVWIPVVILGGASMNDDAALLKVTEDAMEAGAAGIAMGRNVWQHRSPAAIARSLNAIVHQDVSALEALALLKEPLR